MMQFLFYWRKWFFIFKLYVLTSPLSIGKHLACELLYYHNILYKKNIKQFLFFWRKWFFIFKLYVLTPSLSIGKHLACELLYYHNIIYKKNIKQFLFYWRKCFFLQNRYILNPPLSLLVSLQHISNFITKTYCTKNEVVFVLLEEMVLYL